MAFTKHFFRLFFGLFLFGIAMAMMVNAHLGLQPWDVLHQGLSHAFHITMGTASVIVSLIIVGINYIFKEKIGLATLANAIFVGVFFDLVMVSHLIPVYHNIFLQTGMLFVGEVINAIATYFYLSVGYGAGPRDGLMVFLTKMLNKPVGFIRFIIESSALVIGFFLGGEVGVGTFLLAFMNGPLIQLVFQINHFDVKIVKQKYINKAMELCQENGHSEMGFA